MACYQTLKSLSNVSVSQVPDKVIHFLHSEYSECWWITVRWYCCPIVDLLRHWGRVTHICVSNLTTIGSDNGLLPGRCQTIIWTIGGIVLLGPMGINFSEILIEISASSFKEMYLKVSSAKWRLFHLGSNVLIKHTHFVPWNWNIHIL